MKATTGDDRLAELLSHHPRIGLVATNDDPTVLTLESPGRSRRLHIADARVEQYGLLELMDNNPIVCADDISIPSLAASLFLITLGPLLLSGLVVEPPSFVTNLNCHGTDLARAVRSVGWDDEVDIMTEAVHVGGIALATGIAVIQSVSDPEELAEFYLERFGKSPLIRMEGSTEWSPQLVEGKPLAIYRITVNPDEPTSLVSVKAMVDFTGAFQAAQMVTAMNVMYGFEDEMGLVQSPIRQASIG